MKSLLESAIEAGFEISNEPFVMPPLVKQLYELALEHNACSAQFRGWLVGNEVPFTEEFGSVEDGIIYNFGHFILDEYPEFGFSFEDVNDGEIIGLTHWYL